MRNAAERRGITCRWEGRHVIVDLGSLDGPETLLLSFVEAEALADGLFDRLLDAQIDEQFGLAQRETFDVCDVPLTFDEATDLLFRLERLVVRGSPVAEAAGRTEIACCGVDWRREGF